MDHKNSRSASYAAAGVDVTAGYEAVRRIKPMVESTYIPGVLGTLGGFGGMFAIEESAVSGCMGRDKVRDHISTGAEYITGADSSCLMHMQGVIEKEGLAIRTKHIVEILTANE